jgi:voltage-gated potassium channel
MRDDPLPSLAVGGSIEQEPRPASRLHAYLSHLYLGDSPEARRFRYGLLVFDVVTIVVFLIACVAREEWWMTPVDLVLAVLITAEFASRLYVEPDKRRHLLSIATIADIVVIASLLLPAFIDNLGFLRIARALRVLRSYHLLRDLRADSRWFRCNEDIVTRTINFLVFMFVVTSVVYVTQNDINPQIKTYIDALYFTVTTLTTTGFGDITLQGAGGRLLSIVIMVIGVSLFLRLLQAIFRPTKVKYECPDCGLLLHDTDAVHCKHCGRVVHIRDEGVV